MLYNVIIGNYVYLLLNTKAFIGDEVMKIIKFIVIIFGIIFLFGCTNKVSFDKLPKAEINKTIEINDVCDFTIQQVAFYQDIFQEGNKTDTSPEGFKKVVFKVDFKNLKNEDINLKEFIKLNLNYNSKYTYDETCYFGFEGDGTIKPLGNSIFYIYTEVPDEVLLNRDKLLCICIVANKDYAYIGEIENYYEYYKDINDIFKDSNEKQIYSELEQYYAETDEVGKEIDNISPFDSNVDAKVENYQNKISIIQAKIDKSYNNLLLENKRLLSSIETTTYPQSLEEGHKYLIEYMSYLVELTEHTQEIKSTSEAKELVLEYNKKMKESSDYLKENFQAVEYIQNNFDLE